MTWAAEDRSAGDSGSQSEKGETAETHRAHIKNVVQTYQHTLIHDQNMATVNVLRKIFSHF